MCKLNGNMTLTQANTQRRDAYACSLKQKTRNNKCGNDTRPSLPGPALYTPMDTFQMEQSWSNKSRQIMCKGTDCWGYIWACSDVQSLCSVPQFGTYHLENSHGISVIMPVIVLRTSVISTFCRRIKAKVSKY